MQQRRVLFSLLTFFGFASVALAGCPQGYRLYTNGYCYLAPSCPQGYTWYTDGYCHWTAIAPNAEISRNEPSVNHSAHSDSGAPAPERAQLNAKSSAATPRAVAAGLTPLQGVQPLPQRNTNVGGSGYEGRSNFKGKFPLNIDVSGMFPPVPKDILTPTGGLGQSVGTCETRSEPENSGRNLVRLEGVLVGHMVKGVDPARFAATAKLYGATRVEIHPQSPCQLKFNEEMARKFPIYRGHTEPSSVEFAIYFPPGKELHALGDLNFHLASYLDDRDVPTLDVVTKKFHDSMRRAWEEKKDALLSF